MVPGILMSIPGSSFSLSRSCVGEEGVRRNFDLCVTDRIRIGFPSFPARIKNERNARLPMANTKRSHGKGYHAAILGHFVLLAFL